MAEYYFPSLKASIGGNTAGVLAPINTGTLFLAGGNNITLSQNGNSITISGGGGGAGDGGNVLAAGTQTANTTGTVIFQNSNGIGFGMSNSSVITASYTVPTVTNSSWTASDSATNGTVARLAFTNLNGITLALSTGAGGSHTIVGSHNALTSQSNQNITAGNGGFAFQTLSFSNTHNVSFSTSAGSAIVASASFPAQSNQQMTLFATGNTTQSSTGTTNASSIIFRGEGGASVGITGGSIVISTPVGGGGGITAVNITAGTTNGNLSNFSFANTNGVSFQLNGSTISGSVETSYAPSNHSHGNPTLALTNLSGTTASASNGFTLSLAAAAPGGGFTRSRFNPFMEAVAVASQFGQGTLHIHPIPDPEAFQFDRMLFDVQGTQATATNSSGSATVSMWAGLYTRNVSTLSLLASSSTSLGLSISGTVRQSLNNGARLMSLGWTTTISQADLWLGIVSRTTTAGANLYTISQYAASDINSNFSGVLGEASNATRQNVLGLGIYTATTSGIPGSIGFSQIQGTASQFLRVPMYYFLSQTV